MKTRLVIGLLLGLGGLALSGLAAAHVDVGVNIGVPAPVYVAPAPVYAPPPPVVYQPAPVVVTPGVVVGWHGDQYWDGRRYWGRDEWYRHHGRGRWDHDEGWHGHGHGHGHGD